MAAAALLASSAMLRRLVFTSMMLLLQQYAQAEDCCAKCLNNVPDFVYNSMDFKQCIAQNYCCFHCFNKDIGSPTVLPVAGTVFNGPTTTATTGSFLQIKWDKADQVTFVSFAPNQAKSGIPVLASSQAIKKDGSIFLICPQYAGMLYFRGFGTDTCNSVSVEYPITVRPWSPVLQVCHYSRLPNRLSVA
ncbi:hypothetical protein DYB28_005840 [Aphanomyces astaci]|uniref:Uncharacterized protein n=1 Tax=Aphanomyces astaci TaxID=112090 RepID=A0A9X8DZE4_APHAT|nr:hypothetical protein DYB28_005840 [Aphanomyces astaci]